MAGMHEQALYMFVGCKKSSIFDQLVDHSTETPAAETKAPEAPETSSEETTESAE